MGMLVSPAASSFIMHFICPLCRAPLVPNQQGLVCAQQHHFDRAKEGYFNLLPAQHKNSREPGDAKLQLQARRTFLQASFFSPLLPVLQKLIPRTTETLLDIGCGEGYFTRALGKNLSSGAQIYGIDIAKAGIKLAAKQHAGHYAVASSFALPIADHSMDVITRIYAPSCDEELQRVLTVNGLLIIVTPAVNHLLALRELLYKQVRPHPAPQAPMGFVLQHTERASFTLSVPAGVMTQALLQMTPFAWRLPTELLQQLLVSGLEDQADFSVSLYQRNGQAGVNLTSL